MKRLNANRTLSFPRSYTPRWVTFLFDLSSALVSITLSFMIFFNFDQVPKGYPLPDLSLVILGVVLIRAATFLIFRSNASIIRYTNIEDAKRITLVVFSGSLFLGLINLISYLFVSAELLLPFSVVTLDFLIAIFLMSGLRLMIKSVYDKQHLATRQKPEVIIYGADQSGIITKQTLERDAGSHYRITAFFDNQPAYTGKKIENLNIHHLNDLPGFLERYHPDKLIIA